MRDIQTDIKTLQMHDSFARSLSMIHSLRDETIAELHEADESRIQQISGRILTYDQILQMCDWSMIQKKHRDSI